MSRHPASRGIAQPSSHAPFLPKSPRPRLPHSSRFSTCGHPRPIQLVVHHHGPGGTSENSPSIPLAGPHNPNPPPLPSEPAPTASRPGHLQPPAKGFLHIRPRV